MVIANNPTTALIFSLDRILHIRVFMNRGLRKLCCYRSWSRNSRQPHLHPCFNWQGAGVWCLTKLKWGSLEKSWKACFPRPSGNSATRSVGDTEPAATTSSGVMVSLPSPPGLSFRWAGEKEIC